MHSIGHSFVILESVDSTNNYAMGMVHAGLAKHGQAYFSMTQTSGRGQRGKSWESADGDNIILSCIVEPALLSLKDPVALSLKVALACYDLVNHYTNGDACIKWPNDLYWNDRKAGGILIENRFKGSGWQYAVIGIGINVNQTSFSGSITNPVSLKQITGKDYDVIALARELCSYIQKRTDPDIADDFLMEYNDHLYKKGSKALLKVQGVETNTVIKGVNAYGQLVTFDQKEKLYNWGEVEWMK